MFYAVKVGRKTGIFPTWDACKKQVEGYSGAQYKKFKTEEEAQAYIRGYAVTSNKKAQKISSSQSKLRKAETIVNPDKLRDEQHREASRKLCASLNEDEAIAYTDGSFDQETGKFGYGCVLYMRSGEQVFSGCSDEKNFAEVRNISGECLGAIMALKEAVKNGCSKLTICHDYNGIGYWATGAWQAKSLISILYVKYLRKVQQYMTVEFKWVKGHGTDEHNIRVDRIASKAVHSNKTFDIVKFFTDAGIDIPFMSSNNNV